MRLAQIPFVNASPFNLNLAAGPIPGLEILQDSPRDLGDLARQGKADAGLFSLIDCLSLVKAGDFEYAGDLGVSCRGAIDSILLFGVADPRDLEGKTIGVTGQSATSVKLLEVWLKNKIGLKEFWLAPLSESAEASLLIGDQAIARLLSHSLKEPDPIDLCEQWSSWTGLPFVFARWAVRRSVPEEQKQALRQALEQSLERALKDPAAVARIEARRTGFPAEFIARYLKKIVYRLGPEEKKGIARFTALLGGL